jgi:hypothetical protein
MTHAWFIDTAHGATGAVAQNQLTLGGDLGYTIIMAFKEVVPGTGVPNVIYVIIGD